VRRGDEPGGPLGLWWSVLARQAEESGRENVDAVGARFGGGVFARVVADAVVLTAYEDHGCGAERGDLLGVVSGAGEQGDVLQSVVVGGLGDLAVMLPLRLLANGEATPGAIVSVSPWTDLTIQNPAVDENEENDKLLSRNTLELFRGAWLQEPGVDYADPQVSLVNADLTGLPPTAVHYGEYETLADDGAELGRRLADFKVTSEVHALPEGQHSFVLGAGRVPEVDQAIQQMGEWLRKHLGA